MKSFIEKHSFWFALILTVAMNAIGFVVVAGGRAIGLPQIPLIFTVAILTTAIPLGFIHGLGWWRDAGFAPPNPVHFLADIPLSLYLVRWLPSLVVTIYIMKKPLTATINDKPIGLWKKQFSGFVDADVQPMT